MRTLQKETGTAIVLITHDLGVVAEVADDVVVMYAGRIVERGPVSEIFSQPQHPYTVGLLGAIPRMDVARKRLISIEGQVPNPAQPPTGCGFAQRCPFADDQCVAQIPVLLEVGAMHQSACFKAPLDPERLPGCTLLEVAA
jgi:ABC-type dipeptide/oligopeptide/nickel transport system ATPase component